MSAWGTLEALAAEETLLIADERFDDLAELNARRALLLAALPSPLPAVATGPLRRALSIQRATATVLQARCDALGTELGRRGVDAGSRVLPAGDEMLQTLVNLKH